MFTMKGHSWLDEKGVVNAMRNASTPRLMQCGFTVERHAKISMKAGGKRGSRPRGRGRIQVPSPPGKPPHAQTKNLRNSIRTAAATPTRVLVGPTYLAWYGRVHEFGDRTHPPRPFMGPALRACASAFPQLFRGIRLRFSARGRP